MSTLNKTTVVMLVPSLLAVLAGCSGADKPDQPKAQQTDTAVASNTAVPEPVTLKFLLSGGKLTDIEYERYFVNFLKEKLPYVTLERLQGTAGDIVASGVIPDIVYTDTDFYMPLKQLNLPFDMTDLIKKSNLDLGAFVPETVEAVRKLDPDKKMTGVPFNRNVGALFYNKELFDKFGIAYPKDSMTWDEVLELSRKMTREQDGVSYIGWEPGFPDVIASPYTLPYVDPKTNKAVIDDPVYKKVFELMKQVYEQPGFVGPNNKWNYGPDGFMKDRNVAMITEWMVKMVDDLITGEEKGIGPKWDLVTIPNFPDKAGMGRHGVTHMLFVSQQSKNKEQAMEVIKALTSREAQALQSAYGRITVLNDPDIVKQFGSQRPGLQGKNTAAIFKFKSSPISVPNLYDKDIQPIIRAIRPEIAINKKDVNTALREAQEKADKKLAELMK
ncbi:hypothetical protein PAESOLCIP111_05499 [Paenibacillus solanacearum]|uniref:Extracellular solute-binding protein n=1 Tax=Paenibacillus solanacearum TaxID=2048548 RepID=A0A916K695_9BACL|nr:extracellular solute-binding protein [Paenibacillus solanacearum]CAG7647981.1 hypothetical protein PAESOLCIP111_05499 [Paenibacillus solanacearum]